MATTSEEVDELLGKLKDTEDQMRVARDSFGSGERASGAQENFIDQNGADDVGAQALLPTPSRAIPKQWDRGLSGQAMANPKTKQTGLTANLFGSLSDLYLQATTSNKNISFTSQYATLLITPLEARDCQENCCKMKGMISTVTERK